MVSLTSALACKAAIAVIASALASSSNALSPTLHPFRHGCRDAPSRGPWRRTLLQPSRPKDVMVLRAAPGRTMRSEPAQHDTQRRSFMHCIATLPALASLSRPLVQHANALEEEVPFHSAAYGREEYTNSIVASRDTNISPKEVYDTIASDFLKEALDAARKERGVEYTPRALDVGSGAGVSTEVLYNLGYKRIDALDWSGSAWEKYVVDDPSGTCPPSVKFYELDDERYLDQWRSEYGAPQQKGNAADDGLFDVIVFNFAVNESKASQFARELLNKRHGRLLAPINTSNDYWLKQTYKVLNSEGDVLWSAVDVGAWSVQFQPDVTQDTCSGVWCAPFNGFVKKK